MNSFLSSPIPRFSGLVRVLEEIIESHGERIFSQLARSEMALGVADPSIIPTLEEFWGRSRSDFDHLCRLVKQRVFRMNFLQPLKNLKTATSFLNQGGGFMFSWIISQSDIEFCTRKVNSGSIYLHRPLVLTLSIFLGWFTEILILAESHPLLSASDRRIITVLKGVLSDFRSGFQAGVYRKELFIKFIQSVKIVKKPRSFILNIDPQLFVWLETQLTHVPV